MKGAALGVTLVFCVTWGGSALAQDRKACVSAYEQGQLLRQQRHLRRAREELLVCARDSCSKALRPECAEWLTEVEQALPSIVLGARTADGRDVTDVRAWIDGELAAERLEGAAIDIDPGVHRVRFERPPMPPIELEVVIREGEKRRPIIVDLAQEPKPPPPSSSPPSPPPPSPPPPVREAAAGGDGDTQRLVGWISVGGGALFVVGAVAFGLLGLQARSDFNGSGQTDAGAQDRAVAFRTLANVSWGAAAVAGVAGAALLLTAPRGNGLHVGLGAIHWCTAF
jgi:hypothetical protein